MNYVMGLSSSYDAVDPLEAERLVESLRKFEIEEIGCSAWLQQHEVIERLNIQAHQSAASISDEYVLEALLTYDKLDVLVNDLITLEAWKDNVYPLLLDEVAGKNTMRCYFILYHEATLVNFFEVLLYHKHVCENLGEWILLLSVRLVLATLRMVYTYLMVSSTLYVVIR